MKKITGLLAMLAILMISCDSQPSLQKYFVESSDKANFSTIDIAPTFIKTDSIAMSEDEKKALKSFKKLNVLIYKTDSLDQAAYSLEKNNVKDLLKGEDYSQLMKYGSGSEGAAVYTVGGVENIDEFVVFAHREGSGFGVIRVLGNDMTPNNVLSLIGLMRKANFDMEQLKPLQQAIK